MGICMGLLIAKKAYPSLIERIAFMYYILLACVRHGSLPIMTSTNFISRTPKKQNSQTTPPRHLLQLSWCWVQCTIGQLPGPLCSQDCDKLNKCSSSNAWAAQAFLCLGKLSKLIHDIWLRCTTGYFASTWQVKDGQQSLSMERMASIWEI